MSFGSTICVQSLSCLLRRKLAMQLLQVMGSGDSKVQG